MGVGEMVSCMVVEVCEVVEEGGEGGDLVMFEGGEGRVVDMEEGSYG